MTKKVLITGGAGYVGCILTKTLLQHNFKVVVVDCLWFNQITPSIWIHDPNYTFINGDIRDQKTLDKCFKSEIDYVIHAAAVVGDPASKLFPHETKTINFDASQLLLTMSQKNNVKGVVFLSTCSNYGVSDGLAEENSPLNPLSLYAQTKVEVEQMLINETYNLNWIVGRLSTVYGSSPRMRFDLTVNDFTLKAFKDKYIDIFLPKSYRPYIHVYDLSMVITELLISFETTKNNVFNIGFENENYQKIEIANSVLEHVPDLKIDILKEGGDKRDYQVNFAKLHKFINVQKKYNVKKSVNEMLSLLKQYVITDYDNEIYSNSTPRIKTKTV